MPLAIPTLRELRTQTQAEVASRLGLGALLQRSVLYVLARTMAGGVFHVFSRAQFIERQIWDDTADGPELERRASIAGIYRKPASRARVQITFTGAASVLPAGTRARRADGVEFETTVRVDFAFGSATADADAVVAGAAANSEDDTPLTLTSPLVDVDSNAQVASTVTFGADVESDDNLRARLLQRRRNPPQGGAPADYIAWALQVPGVTRAWAKRAYPEPGKVGVLFVLDGDPVSIIPDAPKVAEVQAYLDPLVPATAQAVVFAPGEHPIDIEIALSPDTPTVRASVNAALVELFRRQAAPGVTAFVSKIREAISNAAGEDNHDLVAPVSDTAIAVGDIATLGTVTYS